MKEYTDTPSRGKFGLLPDGTLGYPDAPAILFGAVDFGHDNPLPDPRPFDPWISPYVLPDDYQHVAHVDWMRATAKGADVLHTIDAICDLLVYNQKTGDVDTDIQFRDIDKTILNYPKQKQIMVVTDKALTNIGTIAYDDNPYSGNLGVMVDIPGSGLTYLTINAPHKIRELSELLSGYGYTLSRVDLALDLPGDYCRLHGITVPSVKANHKNGRIPFGFSGSGRSLTQGAVNDVGDWGWNSYGDPDAVRWQDYDPTKYAKKGLTHYIGSRKGSFCVRAYEKSKQLVSVADLGDDHDLDLWAVRIEVEHKKDKNQAPLSWDMITSPDAFFLAGRPARKYLEDYRDSLGVEQIAAITRQRFERHKALSLLAKIHWGKVGYGRLIKTLVDSGLTPVEICDLLVRDVGLKDFIYDLDALDNHSGETLDINALDPDKCPQSSVGVIALRKALGLWSDFPVSVVSV